MIKKLIESASWVGGVNVINGLASFVLTVLVIRHIDAPTYGEYVVGILYAENASFFIILNFGLAIIQYDRRSYGADVIGAAAHLIRLNIVILSIFGLSLLILLIDKEKHILVIIAFIVTFMCNIGMYLARFVFSIQEKDLNFKYQAICMSVSNCTSLIIALLFFMRGSGVWTLVIREIFRVFVILICIRRDVAIFVRPIYDKTIGRSLTMFCLKRHVIKMTEVAYFRTPLLVAGIFVGRADLARFSIAYQLGDQIKGLLGSIIQKVGVAAYAYNSEKGIIMLFLSGYLLSRIFLIVYILLSLYGSDLFSWVYGQKWSDSLVIFSNLIPYIVLFPIVTNISAYFFSKNYLFISMFIWISALISLWVLISMKMDVESLAKWYVLSAGLLYLFHVLSFVIIEKLKIWLPLFVFIGPVIIVMAGSVTLAVVYLLLDAAAVMMAVKYGKLDRFQLSGRASLEMGSN